jgi:hypothetical protein
MSRKPLDFPPFACLSDSDELGDDESFRVTTISAAGMDLISTLEAKKGTVGLESAKGCSASVFRE